MAKLSLASGGTELRDILLVRETTTIGRAPHNDVVIDQRAVSAEHAMIVTRHGDFFLEDLNSTNGTRVNGQPVKKHYLQDGDVIEIAQVMLTYSLQDATVAERMPSLQGPCLKIMNGPHAGKVTPLRKPLTSIGSHGGDVAVVARRADGFYLSYLEGAGYPMVNGAELRAADHRLAEGDEIELAGTLIRYQVY
jgi:predicted component of type VI protein secretion system